MVTSVRTQPRHNAGYADRDQNAGHESCGESFRSQRKCHNDAVREIRGPQLEDFPR